MSDSTTLQLCRNLKAAIDERMLGTQVQAAGHSGRSVSYTTMPIEKLVNYYNQMRASCAEAIEELPPIAPLDQEPGGRGAPARFIGRGYV